MPSYGGSATGTGRVPSGAKSGGLKRRPFSALVDDLLSDVSDFVDEAILTHREWVQLKKAEIREVIAGVERLKPPPVQNPRWDFYADSDTRVNELVARHVQALRSHLEEDLSSSRAKKRAKTTDGAPHGNKSNGGAAGDAPASGSVVRSKTATGGPVVGQQPASSSRAGRLPASSFGQESERGARSDRPKGSHNLNNALPNKQDPRGSSGAAALAFNRRPFSPRVLKTSTSSGSGKRENMLAVSQKNSRGSAKSKEVADTGAPKPDEEPMETGLKPVNHKANDRSPSPRLVDEKASENAPGSGGTGKLDKYEFQPEERKVAASTSVSSKRSKDLEFQSAELVNDSNLKPSAIRAKARLSGFAGTNNLVIGKNKGDPATSSTSSGGHSSLPEGSKELKQTSSTSSKGADLVSSLGADPSAANNNNSTVEPASGGPSVEPSAGTTSAESGRNLVDGSGQKEQEERLSAIAAPSAVIAAGGEQDQVSGKKHRKLAAEKLQEVLGSGKRQQKEGSDAAMLQIFSTHAETDAQRRRSDVDMDALFEDTTDVFESTSQQMPAVALTATSGTTTADTRNAIAGGDSDKGVDDRQQIADESRKKASPILLEKSPEVPPQELVQPQDAVQPQEIKDDRVEGRGRESSRQQAASSVGSTSSAGVFGGGAARILDAADAEEVDHHIPSISTGTAAIEAQAVVVRTSDEQLQAGSADQHPSSSAEDGVDVIAERSDVRDQDDPGLNQDRDLEEDRHGAQNEQRKQVIRASDVELEAGQGEMSMDTGLLFGNVEEADLHPEITAPMPRELNFEAPSGVKEKTTTPGSADNKLFPSYASVSAMPADSVFASHSLFSNQASTLFKSGGETAKSSSKPGSTIEQKASSALLEKPGSTTEQKSSTLLGKKEEVVAASAAIGAGSSSSSHVPPAKTSGRKSSLVLPKLVVAEKAAPVAPVEAEQLVIPDPVTGAIPASLMPSPVDSVGSAGFFSLGAASDEAAYMTVNDASSGGPSSTDNTPNLVAEKDVGTIAAPASGGPEAAADAKAAPNETAKLVSTTSKVSELQSSTTLKPSEAGRQRREAERKRLETLRSRRLAIRHLKRAEDNYELSDKCSTDEDSPDRSHKRVPDWCRNWPEKVAQQGLFDPDTIFGCKVANPDLSRIFGANLRTKKKRRGSSENWENDRLTRREVEAYKKRTNQVREWTAIQEGSS
ncbi:unnamed protein product [Amoebophrya sp. A25]|nr:unnamed protein product [Amoebophrya sp. A25]|eukprot:GSA25T00013297001.1